ncbi:MAG: tetratricopeptide repeat protein [Planctomycetota bacterium]
MIELLLVISALAPGLVAPSAQTPTAASAGMEALRRDPRTLEKAEPGRWRDFGVDSDEQSGVVPAGMRDAVLAIHQRDLPLALERLYGVLEKEPDYPPALYEMGVVYFRLQRYGDAAATLERLLEAAPALLARTRVLGHCYYSLGDYARAKEHYQRVLALSPREIEAIRGLALSELHLGAPEQAEKLLDELLGIDPRHAEAWAWKAQVLLDLERPDAALAAASRARDLDPWQPRPWFLLGRILLDLGREKEGVEAQERYRALSAAAQEAHTIESRLEYAPHDPVLLRRLVDIHASTGDIRSARRALARLVVERPTDVDLRILAVDVLERMRDAEGARIAAEALADRCSGEWKTWERLERYYARTGRLQERLQAGEKARRLKPD